MEQKQQLTIRLDLQTIKDLDAVVELMQQSSPAGIEINRTDALRSAIVEGIESIKSSKAKAAPPKKAAKR